MDLFFMCNHCGVEIKIATSQPGSALSCPLCNTINHPPAQHLEHGAILAGDRILHRIEANGATETSLAELLENHSLNRLQTFASATFSNGPAADYYLTAMKQWMKVRQPNIVKVLYAGRSSTGTFFAASAPIPGITLENRLWQGGAMDLKSAIHLAIFRTTSQADENAGLHTRPRTETPKPSPGTTRFMALLIETRKFARQNPHKYEEILDRYEQLLAMAETNAPRWVSDLERQVRAIDLTMAAPLDDAEQAIRLRVKQYEESGQYQAGIDWLEKYSGSFVNKT
ncbi:MAG: hypothetical protein WCI03_10600 [bacterium]|jgi:hypothetical protein